MRWALVLLLGCQSNPPPAETACTPECAAGMTAVEIATRRVLDMLLDCVKTSSSDVAIGQCTIRARMDLADIDSRRGGLAQYK